MSMWSCFTNGRELPGDLKGYQVQYRHTDQAFSFALLKDGNVVVSKYIDRGHWHMTSADPLNYSPVFHKAWVEFIDECSNKVFGTAEFPESVLIDIGAWIPEFYGNDVKPKDSGRGLSDDVLIDLTGWRLSFTVGYYNHHDHLWIFRGGDVDAKLFDLKGLKWTYLPLNEK